MGWGGGGEDDDDTEPVFEDLYVHLWRPSLGLFLEPFEVTTKPIPGPAGAGREEKASALPTWSPPPPPRAQPAKPTGAGGRVSTCVVTRPGRSHAWQDEEAVPQLWWLTARGLLSPGHRDSRVGEVEKLPERTNLPSGKEGEMPPGPAWRRGRGKGERGTLQKEIRLPDLPPRPHATLWGALWSRTVQHSSHWPLGGHLNLS